MKSKNQKLFYVAVSIIVLSLMLVGFSFAYFSIHKTIKNTFQIKTYNFSTILFQEGEENLSTNKDYLVSQIQEGDEYLRNLTVKNTGDLDQYIRVKITITNQEKVSAMYEDILDMFKGLREDEWRIYDEIKIVDDQIIIYLYKQNVLKPNEESIVFESIQIPQSVTEKQLTDLDRFDVISQAESIQVLNNEKDAYTAFKNYSSN